MPLKYTALQIRKWHNMRNASNFAINVMWHTRFNQQLLTAYYWRECKLYRVTNRKDLQFAT